jgi:SAM-dependent methyltransferase
MATFDIVSLAAARYPAVLRGQMSGDEALFDAEGISAWVKYFSNNNPLYAISNRLGAIAVEQALPPGTVSILEIGGGLGSGAEALLDRLSQSASATVITDYRFTEISALFLKRSQRNLASRYPTCPFTFAALDMDRPFAEAGITPGVYTLVYGVNVLHVAHDLAATLHEIRQAMTVNGVLVMAECVRPFPETPLHLEFVFNLLSTFRKPLLEPCWRPNGGFLTPEQWTMALESNGFENMRIYPEIARIRDAYPAFVAAAIIARKA